MKKSRRILAIIMAIAISATMLLSPTASADEPKGSITVTSTNLSLAGQEFSAYRIFSVTFNEAHDKFAYELRPAFEGFNPSSILGTKTLAEYLEDLVATPDPDKLNALAKALWQYIDDNKSTKKFEVATATSLPPSESVTFKGLDLGYYLVYCTYKYTEIGYDPVTGDPLTLPINQEVVAACALTTTDPDVEIMFKGDVPTIDKWVWNEHPAVGDPDRDPDDPDYPGTWEKWTDESIGKTVQFKFESSIPKTMIGYDYYTYIIHDEMSPGLTFNKEEAGISIELVATITSLGVPNKLLIPDNDNITFDINTYPYVFSSNFDQDYFVVVDDSTPKGTQFHIYFNPKLFINNNVAYLGGKIVTRYSGILNENAVISYDPNTYGEYGNPNDVWLEYSNTPYPELKPGKETDVTTRKRVKVYTGQFEFIKVENIVVDGVPKIRTLPGAIFQLYKAGSTTPIVFVHADPIRHEDSSGAPIYVKNEKDELVLKEGLPIQVITEVYRVATESEIAANTATLTSLITTPDSGIVRIIGLGASYAEGTYDEDTKEFSWPPTLTELDGFGLYSLEEDTPPAGYHKREKPIPVRILINCIYEGETIPNPDHEVSWRLDYKDEPTIVQWNYAATGAFEVPNSAGPEFPDTGSIGRQIFIIGGLVLMGFAVLGLVITSVRRKKKIVID